MTTKLAQLTVRCLGTLDIRVDGEPITPKRARKAKLLLALLASHGGREVSRESVAARLWPDSDPISAAHNLRQTLSDLRQALGPAGDRVEGGGRTLKLEGMAPNAGNGRDAHPTIGDTDVDVARFDDAIARDNPALAVELYAGPFLNGIEDAWVIAEREQRHRSVLAALDKLAAAAMDRDDVDTALCYRRRSVALAPLDEVVLRSLLTNLRLAGDHSGMVEALRTFERALAKEDPFARPSALTMALVKETRAAPSRAETPRGELPSRPPLPSPLTELVGRDRDIADIAALLARKRLVTLTGPGGVGKTRLAIAVARQIEQRFHHGAVFVDLSAINDPTLVPTAVGASIGLAGILGRLPVAEVIEPLRSAELMIVFDNCDHVIEAAADFATRVFENCPEVRVLATSRERLEFPGEKVWQVSPLAVPDELTNGVQVAEFSGVRLFIDRVDDASHGFRLRDDNAIGIASICRRLDGIPLALELAAVMLTSMDVDTLNSSLERRFEVLTRGKRTAVPRHRTLAAVVDWGFELLTELERELLCRLSIFTGGWEIDAAKAICSNAAISVDDVEAGLVSLVSKSLVVFNEDANRYRLLETIREYAVDKLTKRGQLAGLRERHSRYYARLLDEGTRKGTWPSLYPDLTNIRAAMDWASIEASVDDAIEFCHQLTVFGADNGIYAEGTARYEQLLRRVDLQAPSKPRMFALHWAGWFAMKVGNIELARRYFAQGREVADQIGIDGDAMRLYAGQAELETIAGNFQAAYQFAAECVERARALEVLDSVGWGTVVAQQTLERLGDYRRAIQYQKDLIDYFASRGPGEGYLEVSYVYAASAAVRLGEIDRARQFMAPACRALLVHDPWFGLDVLVVAARIALAAGDPFEAAVIHSILVPGLEKHGWMAYWGKRRDFVDDLEAVQRALSPEELADADDKSKSITPPDIFRKFV